MTKTKIVLDADVIIHFSKGGYLHILPSIFKNYAFTVLDYVYDELSQDTRNQLNNQIKQLKNITVLSFNPSGEMLKEYANLKRNMGKGESACITYCKFNRDVIGSSNLRDIKEYCEKNQLTYLTTLDFLYYAIKHEILTIKEAEIFVEVVVQKGSKLPVVDFTIYTCKTILL